MPGFKAPSVDNLQIAKGVALFTPKGGTKFALGNCPKVVYSPKVEDIDHYSAMYGTKVMDQSIILSKGGELAADMEEQTLNNLSLFFLGDVDVTDPDNPSVGIFNKNSQWEGQFELYQTNDVGPRYYMNLTRVLITPTNQFQGISDGYNAMTVTMKHVIDQNGLFGSLYLKPDVSTIAPENVYAPFITGLQKQGQDPAYAQVGHELTCNKGIWIGSQSYAFQWYVGGSPVSGATNQTYTPVVADHGQTITCDVTASNDIDDTAVMSGATAQVAA